MPKPLDAHPSCAYCHHVHNLGPKRVLHRIYAAINATYRDLYGVNLVSRRWHR